jgi:WD40 repeat protein
LTCCSCVSPENYDQEGKYLVSGSTDTNVKIWDLRTKSSIRTLKGHTKPVNCVSFSPDGKWIASGGDDGCLKVEVRIYVIDLGNLIRENFGGLIPD